MIGSTWIVSNCRDFTYKNFDGEDISEVPVEPSFWQGLQPNAYQVKADLIYCDKREKLGNSGRSVETCSREIKVIVLQNYKPSKEALPAVNFIPTDDPEEPFLPPDKQDCLAATYTRPTPQTFLRERAIKTDCFKWTLDGDKYAKELGEAQLKEVHEELRMEKLYYIGLSALAVFSAAVLAFGVYKLYRRCTQPIPVKNAGPTAEELEKLPFQFRPKVAPGAKLY